MSPRRALREKKAHCFEGALIAALALKIHGHKPLILHLASLPHDDDHIVTLFKQNGFWGAISKTNHSTLRFRDPIFKTTRELAVSYFHEYFDKKGKKTLVGYSRPINLMRFGHSWVTAEDDLWDMDDAIMASHHFPFVSKQNKKNVRAADKMEKGEYSVHEWKRSDPRT